MKVDRMTDEPSKAFAAFQEYLSLGPSRSLDRLAEALNLPPATLRGWSERYNWQDRADSHDLDNLETGEKPDDKELKRRELTWAGRQERIREAEWQISRKLLDRAAAILNNPRVRCSLPDAFRALYVGSILGRRAVGLPLTPDPAPPAGKVFHEVDVRPLIRKVYGEYAAEREQAGSNSPPSQNTIHPQQNKENTLPGHN